MGKEARNLCDKLNQGNSFSQMTESKLPARNLSKQDLGGVIFGCTEDTMRECLSKQLFGLPGGHFSYIKSIEPGLPLFLFNYRKRELHGIYEAASDGQMNIDPYGWTKDGSERTRYPAQVRIRIKMNCRSLSEEKFKKIIHDNYYRPGRFCFELDRVQTRGLIAMLESLPICSSVTNLANNAPYWRIANVDARQEKNKLEIFAPKESCSDHQIPFEDKDLAEEKLPDKTVKDENSVQMFNGSLQLNTEGRFPGTIPCLDTAGKLKESLSNKDKEHIYVKLKQLALNREFSNSHPKLSEEDAVASYVMDDPVEDENCPTMASVLDNCKDVSNDSSDLDSSTDQAYSDMLLQQLSHGCDVSIFVMGGYDGISWLSTLDCYSPSRDIVRPLRPMSLVRSYASATMLQGNIYNFGGQNGNSWFDTVERYNPWNDEWTLCSPLNEKKGCLAGATLHEKIYAIGGGNGVDCFSEVEMFDLSLGRWLLTQSMLQKRFSPAAVELNGVLYVVGGFNGSNYLKSAERLDPREISWSKLQNMHTRRGSHSLAVLNEKLYALGGHDGNKSISSVEVFDPRIGSWMEGEEMKQSRAYSAAVVIGETIYLLGGLKEGRNIADTVDCYKEGHGWLQTNLKGIGKRCFFSATVLSGSCD